MKQLAFYKFILIFIFIFGLSVKYAMGQSNAEIQNIDFYIDGENLIITYDITKAREGETFEVWIRIITDSGAEITPETTSGDIGRGILGLPNRKIFWNLKDDEVELDEEINVAVYAKSTHEEEKISTLTPLQLNGIDKCMLGTTDAKNYHGKVAGHVILGVLFGPFAALGAAIANPTPQKGAKTAYMSKNQDLFNDPAYVNCYKRKAKGKNVGNAFLGWGIWVGLVLIFSASGG